MLVICKMKYNTVVILIPVMVMLLTFMSITMGDRNMDPCHLFPTGTKLRNPDDCSQAITCIDLKSVYGTKKCTGSTPFYDKDKDACAKSLTNDSTCAIDCTQSVGKFLPDPKSCFGHYYCQDQELALYGHCPDTTHFNETMQSCINSYESNCSTVKLDFCSIVKDGVKFKDESSCANYHSCKKGVMSTTKCKAGYFNTITGECLQKSLVDCPNHPLPTNVCGTVKRPKKKQYVSDGATCRGSFFCNDVADGPDLHPMWSQCPQNTFFNEKTQSCMDPLLVACKEDRCDGRDLTFVSAETKGCRNYLVCSNGVQVAANTCGNKFFDEKEGICTSKIITYPSCS